jgi:hypothetical protein
MFQGWMMLEGYLIHLFTIATLGVLASFTGGAISSQLHRRTHRYAELQLLRI